MAGHSKWANIKNRKQGVDKKRGILFTKLAKELMVATKLYGPDIQSNSRLRIAVSKARSANIPKHTIERSIKKGAGELESVQYSEILYEVFAEGGVGILVEVLTDKKARTTPEIKSILSKQDASLAEVNAVSRLFERKGVFLIYKASIEEEKLLEITIEAGTQDIIEEGDFWQLQCLESDFYNISEVLVENKIKTSEAGIQFIPIENTQIEISNIKQAEKLIKLIETLEEYDDVQDVYTNMSLSQEVLEKLKNNGI